MTKGVQIVIGFTDSGASAVQSVIFNNKLWDVEKAKKWLTEHELIASKVDETENTLRFRQKDPDQFTKFRVIKPGAVKKLHTPDVEAEDILSKQYDEVTADVVIKGVDKMKQRVFGWASVSSFNGKQLVDTQKDKISDDELEEMAYRFVQKSGVAGEMHEKVGVGKLIASLVFTKDIQKSLNIDLGGIGWFLGFQVTDKDAWGKVQKGEYKMFSIHGKALRQEK